jgi:CSLREA domain-containing protein
MRLAVVVTLALVLVAAPAQGATVFTVTKQADGAGGCTVADCSLRSAILASNGASGTNTIDVPPGDYTLTTTGPGDDTGVSGDLDVLHGAVTIIGTGGAAATRIHGDGDRIIDVPATATTTSLTLSGLTLTDGGGVRFGAGIQVDAKTPVTLTNDVIADNTTADGGRGAGLDYAPGTTGSGYALTVANTTFSGNVSTSTAIGGGSGGAISFVPAAATGTLTITNSTFTHNAATSAHIGQNGQGGAIEFDAGIGSATIVASTFDSNSATNTVAGGSGGDGGAIWFAPETDTGSTLNITNSTLVNNTANGASTQGSGGAIWLEPGAETATLTNDTLADNAATNPGAAIDNAAPVSTANTIFWGNLAAGMANTCVHAVAMNGGSSGGFNIAGDTSCALGAFGDGHGDPVLGPLADNGGPTQTMSLGAGSSAVDRVPSGCPAVDQRGVVRPQGFACDIGAVEVIPTVVPPPIVPIAPATPVNQAPAVVAPKLTVASGYHHNDDGSIVLTVTVNLAGQVHVRDANTTSAKAAKTKATKVTVSSLTKTVTKPSTFKLTVKPSPSARSILRRKHSASVHLVISFSPKSGAKAVSKSKTVTLRLRQAKHHHR